MNVVMFVFSPGFGNGRSGWINPGGVIVEPKASASADKLPVAYEKAQFNLVSLLKHTPPMVYAQRPPLATDKHNVTSQSVRGDASPPGYDETRALDAFEKTALTRLQGGETLVAQMAKNGTLRMLGAVRAQAACIACHDEVKEGALLGAFSYVLTPVPAKSAPKP